MLINPKHPFWIALLLILTACGTVPPSTPTRWVEPVETITPVPQTPTVLPTETPSPTPIQTPLPPFPLDGLRMAYVKDGNLYVQDGTNPPKQLTHSGEDHTPIFSDDGEKIVFLRGNPDDRNKVYAINADGSQEKSLITNDWLTALGLGTKTGHLAFVPGTHQLLFNTYLCSPQEPANVGCTTGLFLVETDTSELKEFLSPSLGDLLSPMGILLGNFEVSPNGRLLSIAVSGHIDLFSIDGQVIHRNIMTYTRSTPNELVPRQYWLPDSSGLIVALPAETNFGLPYESTPTYTVWRYALDRNVATQIPLEPSPMWFYVDCGDIINVSPDRNWVVYNRVTDDSRFYVGNLRDGHTQSHSLSVDCSDVYWSLDSKYFVYGRFNGTFLSAIDKPLVSIGNISFLGWLDANHYIYCPAIPIDGNSKIFVGEIVGETNLIYESGISLPVTWFTFVILKHEADK